MLPTFKDFIIIIIISKFNLVQFKFCLSQDHLLSADFKWLNMISDQSDASDILVIGQVTRRWRSTRIPVHSGSPDGRGCSTAPEAWAEEVGTDRNPCPSSVPALCMNLTPTLLQTNNAYQHLRIQSNPPESLLVSNRLETSHVYHFWWQSSLFWWYLPSPGPETLSAPMLLKWYKTTSQNWGWGGESRWDSWVSKNLRLHFREKIWSPVRESRHHLQRLRQITTQLTHFIHLSPIFQTANESLALRSTVSLLLHSLLLSHHGYQTRRPHKWCKIRWERWER